MKFIYSAKDKRSKDGTILKYVIRNQTAKIAKQCVNELKINKFYNIFIKNFDNDLIDFYFLNYFFDKIYSTIAKIHIHKWNKTNSKIIQPEIIEIPNFEFIEIFEKFWPEKELNYKIKNFYFEDNGIKISYFRYLLIRYLNTNSDTLTSIQIVNKLKEWNIEVEYDIDSISIQRILNYIK